MGVEGFAANNDPWIKYVDVETVNKSKKHVVKKEVVPYKDVEVVDGGNTTYIGNVKNPIGMPKHTCFYQCVGYQPVNLPALITSIGKLSVGATVVMTATDWVSTHVGPTMVTQTSGPNDLRRNFDRTRPDR